MRLSRVMFHRFAKLLLGAKAPFFLVAMAVFSSAQATPPAVSARAVVIMNAANGEILYARNPHQRLPPASTTKVLTSLIALERLDLKAKALVSARAADTPPSRIGLHAGETVSVTDLLYGVMLKSGNDAAEVIAEAVGSSLAGFAQIMNTRARQIGARNTHFSNPHGLPASNHYSSAYDLALMFEYAMRNPLFAQIVRTPAAMLRIETPDNRSRDSRLVRVHTTNRLLASYQGVRGGKTGYTHAAGRCYVGEVRRGRTRLIVAVLGSSDLWRDVTVLFDYGFSLYDGIPAPGSLIASSIVNDLQKTLSTKEDSLSAPSEGVGDGDGNGWVWEGRMRRLAQDQVGFFGSD